MKLIKTLYFLLQTLAFILLGVIFILLSLNVFTPEQITEAVNYIYTDPNLKLALIAIGGILIIAGIAMTHVNMGRMQMEKTIAFENPEGQVTVSLQAVEDFIKKSVRHIPEVKDLRSSVTASKKGISVICRATLFADSNIPETTERIQSIVKTKVRDMLGVEETINTRINVVKISSKGKQDIQPVKERDEFSRRMPMGSME